MHFFPSTFGKSRTRAMRGDFSSFPTTHGYPFRFLSFLPSLWVATLGHSVRYDVSAAIAGRGAWKKRGKKKRMRGKRRRKKKPSSSPPLGS